MRSIQIQFASGREVLNSYWGFLRSGGLVVSDRRDLSEGDSVVLDVNILTLKQSYKLAAHVVRRAPDGQRAFLAFDEGQEQGDLLLNAAWADSHEVPQRKHRRYPTGSNVLYTGNGDHEKHAGQILDVSPGGCRLRGPHCLPVGTRIRVIALGIELEGQVRWSSAGGREMGVEFHKPALVVQTLLDRA